MSQPATPSGLPGYGLSLNLEDAKRVVAAAEAEARANGWAMVIAVVDAGANLVALQRMDDANIGSLAVAQSKAETAVKFRRSTKLFEDQIVAGGVGLRVLSMREICAVEGGLPIVVDGRVVGGVGVSGAQATQDAQVAAAGAAVLAR
ncbi:heme-binding protein [Uliginosibacterium sp. sgz301328]|uniref:GlcG/HbpS family heme-binding protein n=1 Tax=Uliginosibacterium sp. sgz301328 TaxID=3243764 RepID=UPI00359D00C1